MTNQTFEIGSRTDAIPIPSHTPIGVIGAGTMGSGIAQVAAVAGHRVKIFDTQTGAMARAIESIKAALRRGVARRTVSEQEASAAVNRVVPVMGLEELADSGLVIEAIAENLKLKQDVFQDLEKIVAPDCILATNTSSLSITELATALDRPERFVGMHFFNPAPLMELTEIVSGLATDPQIIATVAATAKAWNKTPVHARSTPGFIVNRVARPFYAEALRLLSELAADHDYGKARTLAISRSDQCSERAYRSIVGLLQTAGFNVVRLKDLPALVVMRIVTMVINEAADAVHYGVSSKCDVDLAMRKGVNYPAGPFGWAARLGTTTVYEVLQNLATYYGEDRYRTSPLIERSFWGGRRLDEATD